MLRGPVVSCSVVTYDTVFLYYTRGRISLIIFQMLLLIFLLKKKKKEREDKETWHSTSVSRCLFSTRRSLAANCWLGAGGLLRQHLKYLKNSENCFPSLIQFMIYFKRLNAHSSFSKSICETLLTRWLATLETLQADLIRREPFHL